MSTLLFYTKSEALNHYIGSKWNYWAMYIMTLMLSFKHFLTYLNHIFILKQEYKDQISIEMFCNF